MCFQNPLKINWKEPRCSREGRTDWTPDTSVGGVDREDAEDRVIARELLLIAMFLRKRFIEAPGFCRPGGRASDGTFW